MIYIQLFVYFLSPCQGLGIENTEHIGYNHIKSQTMGNPIIMKPCSVDTLCMQLSPIVCGYFLCASSHFGYFLLQSHSVDAFFVQTLFMKYFLCAISSSVYGYLFIFLFLQINYPIFLTSCTDHYSTTIYSLMGEPPKSYF
jgi:hypothetical protein